MAEILKEGEHVTLQVDDGIYFPKEMSAAALAYQVVNNKTKVVEFEEVQLAAAWEAFQHFDKFLGEIYAEMSGERKAPSLALVGADEMPPNPDITH
jgi:hypothetical protein